MKFSPLAILCPFLFFIGSYFSNIAYASLGPNVWDVLRNQFQLNHEVNNPAVQAQLRWLIAHPNYLQQLAKSEPYIYHIVTEIKERGLPGELALLPMIESAYNPFAYSVVGAAGLWQLMPGTGNDLGLKQDWWFDARRSIPSSTKAALNFLTHLNRYFNGNWILAIASYDAGKGTVERAIKNSGQSSKTINFWILPLPNETRMYVPRFLALAEIIKYPQRYRLTLPEIPYAPYFAEVNIGTQIDLNHAAKLAGISYKDLIKLNPGYNHWTTAPNQPFKLLIPAAKVNDFTRNLAQVPLTKRVSLIRHLVGHGDNLSSIAQRYFTTVKLIRELNQLKSDQLQLGQFLLIPSSKNTAVTVTKLIPDKPASVRYYKVIHIVQHNENYKILENKYHVSTLNIQNWNHKKLDSALLTGEQLIIWKRVVNYGNYTVKQNDTLKRIAELHHTSVATLTRLNPQLAKTPLKPGQQLLIG